MSIPSNGNSIQPLSLIENPNASDPDRERRDAIEADNDLQGVVTGVTFGLNEIDDDVSAGSGDVDQQARMTDAVLEETRNKLDTSIDLMKAVADELKAARKAGRKLEPDEIAMLEDLSKQYTETMGNFSDAAMKESLRFTQAVGQNAAAENEAAKAAKTAKDWAIVGAVFSAASGVASGQPLAAARGIVDIGKAGANTTFALGGAVRSGAAAAMETAPGKTAVFDITDQDQASAKKLFDQLDGMSKEFKATAEFNGGQRMAAVSNRIAAGREHIGNSYNDAAEETMAVSMLQNLHQQGAGYANTVTERQAEDGSVEKGTNLAFVRRSLEAMGYKTYGGGASDHIYGDYDNTQAGLASLGGPAAWSEVTGPPLWSSSRAGSGGDDEDLTVASYEGDGETFTEAWRNPGLSLWTKGMDVGYRANLENVDDQLEDVDLDNRVRALRGQYWENATFSIENSSEAVGRVICTHFYRCGQLDRETWRADLRFTAERLSGTTIRGYQYWAIPYVKLMRRSKLAERIMLPIARHRANELAYQLGMRRHGSLRGKAVRLLFEPACYLIGLAVKQKDWRSLWDETGMAEITRDA